MPLKSSSLEETAQIAACIAPLLQKTPCLLLRGGLGAGKTSFAKFLIHILTKTPIDEIVSPTYNYVHLYENSLAHFDLYRVQSRELLEELGLDELLQENTRIKVIEWPDVALSLLPRNRLEITINPCGRDERLFSFCPLILQEGSLILT
jgi:tRNA threonylcarbamoyl adenosine modification protein YjeE